VFLHLDFTLLLVVVCVKRARERKVNFVYIAKMLGQDFKLLKIRDTSKKEVFSTMADAPLTVLTSHTQKAHYSPPWADMSIIGVAGSSGSGKTSLAIEIVQSLNLPWVIILSIVRPLPRPCGALAHMRIG
jgi:gluconate kinase